MENLAPRRSLIQLIERTILVGAASYRAWFSQRGIWLACVIMVAITAGGAAILVWDMHERTVAEYKRAANTIGTILAERTTRYMQVADRVLQELQLRVETLDIEGPEDFQARLGTNETYELLRTRMQNLPAANAFVLIDAMGHIASLSRGPEYRGVDVSESDFFKHFVRNNDTAVYFSVTRRSRFTGMLTLFMARRINRTNGQFLGVVASAIDVADLSDFHRAVNTLPGQTVSLLRTDGTFLTRDPDPTQITGQRIPDNSAWYGVIQSGGGTFRSMGFVSGTTGIVSAHPLHGYPLVINVSILEYVALAGWRREAWLIGSATAWGVVGFLFLFCLIARQIQRQKAQNAELLLTADALRSSEARLGDFAHLASDWLWEQDAELRFVDAGFRTPLRIDGDMLHIGKRRWEVTDTTAAPEHWQRHQQDLLSRRRFADFRFDMMGRDGRNHHVSVSGTPIYDRAGEFVGYRGIGRDVTAVVDAELELRSAKERAEQAGALLRDATNSMSEGFVIFDRDDKFVMCNDAYRKIHATSLATLRPGMPVEDVLRQMPTHTGNPNVVRHESEWFEERIRAFRDSAGSIDHLMPNGSWILITYRRMKNGGTAGMSIDITALKQARAALLTSEARLDRAQAIAGIGSWELDLVTSCYVWSKEMYRMRGLDPGNFEPNTANVADYVHPADFLGIQRWLEDLAAHQEPSARITRIIRPDGEVRVLRVEGRAEFDADGVIRRLAGTMQDITDTQMIERQLAQAQKMEAIGNLTGGMAHDFNNGLGIIIGNLDLLGRLVKADPIATELCDDARDGAHRCADLIRLLLAFARKQPLHPRQIDVNILVDRTVKLLSRTLGEDITIGVELGVSMPPILVDPAQLEAALANLANNARDAMPMGGRLGIVTRAVQIDAQYVMLHPETEPGQYILIEISDTGTGIAPEVAGKIFEPFFTTKEAGRGSGLGLSMVFGFVKQSGGHITVHSDPGRGTTFGIYLPTTSTDHDKMAAIAGPRPVVGGDEIVLVVEDNKYLRRSTSRQLAELGYHVQEAEDASKALGVLTGDNHVDLLFSDVVMPGVMDGLDLAHAAVRLRPTVKILLTSGFPGVRGASPRIADCPFPLLNKPYRHDDLAQAVRDILDQPVRHVPSPDCTASTTVGAIHDATRTIA